MRLVQIAERARRDTPQTGELPVLDGFGLVLEQALGPLHPAGRNRTGREKQIATREPQSEPRGTCPLVAAQVAVERTLTRIDAPFGRTRP